MERRRVKKPVAVSDLLAPLARRFGWSRRAAHRAVFDAWDSIAPENISARCRAVSFREGRLIVKVNSAPLLEELRCFRASEFLGLINEELNREKTGVVPVIRKVDFRLS